MTIPMWLFYSANVAFILLVGAASLLAGREHRRYLARKGSRVHIVDMPPSTPVYNVTVNVSGRRDDLSGFEAMLLKTLEDAAKDGAS